MTQDPREQPRKAAAARDEKSLRNAEPQEFTEALQGVDFPASKPVIVRTAMDKGGIDREVPHVLQQIEERTYDSLADLQAEIERVYSFGGGLPLGKPAAPP
ncbi:MAG TPA: DUF2795 domain-containing protein [Dehalococcoidia bacterium]